MKKAKAILLKIKNFLLWVFYFFLTQKERVEYMMAKEKGMDCVGSKDVSWLVPGSTTEYRFDRNKKP